MGRVVDSLTIRNPSGNPQRTRHGSRLGSTAAADPADQPERNVGRRPSSANSLSPARKHKPQPSKRSEKDVG